MHLSFQCWTTANHHLIRQLWTITRCARGWIVDCEQSKKLTWLNESFKFDLLVVSFLASLLFAFKLVNKDTKKTLLTAKMLYYIIFSWSSMLVNRIFFFSWLFSIFLSFVWTHYSGCVFEIVRFQWIPVLVYTAPESLQASREELTGWDDLPLLL